MDVEILPWRHDFLSQEHKDLIDYISAIPEGSKLALEITPQQIAFFAQLEASLESEKSMGGKKVRQKLAAFIKKMRNNSLISNIPISGLAIFEVYHLAKMRNLHLIPLETSASERASKIYSQEEAFLFREKTFESQIMAQDPKSKIFVVTGAMHARELERRVSSKTKVSINYRYLSNPAVMIEQLDAYDRYKLAIKEKRHFRALIEKHAFEHGSSGTRIGWKSARKKLFDHYRQK